MELGGVRAPGSLQKDTAGGAIESQKNFKNNLISN